MRRVIGDSDSKSDESKNVIGLLKIATIFLLEWRNRKLMLSIEEINLELKRSEDLEEKAKQLLEKFYNIKKQNDDYEKVLAGLQERLDNLIATVSRYE